MLRPTTSNRTIKLPARRTSPTRPALLVGPSRLLRGDKVQDLNVNRRGDQSRECGADCRNCGLHHAKHNLDPLQVSGRRAPISSRIPVTRVMRTAVPSNQATHPALTSQTSDAVFRAADRRSLHFLATWRKEGVQRPRGFGVFIGDVFAEEAPQGSIQLE